MRKDMQQSFEESVKGGPEEAAKLLAAAIVGERSRTSAGVSAERDAEARGGRHAAYHDLIAPSVISMRAIPKHLFVSSGMQAHRYHLTMILSLGGPQIEAPINGREGGERGFEPGSTVTQSGRFHGSAVLFKHP